MLTVTCFKWFDPDGRYNARFLYTAEHVNRLRDMVGRHLEVDHDFVCITDDPTGLSSEIRFIPIDGDLLSRAGRRFPKLMIFRPDAAQWLGERILMLDLDTIIVNRIRPLVERSEDFVAWQDPNWGRKPGVGKYNSSIVLLRAGSHPEVWTGFDAEKAAGANPSGHSDQAWIWRVLGDNHPVWTQADGVLSFKYDVQGISRGPFRWIRRRSTKLPGNARIVFFHGGVDPTLQLRHRWIREHLG